MMSRTPLSSKAKTRHTKLQHVNKSCHLPHFLVLVTQVRPLIAHKNHKKRRASDKNRKASEKTKKHNFMMVVTYSPKFLVLLGCGCFLSGQAWLTPPAFVQTSQETSLLILKSTVPDVSLSTLKTYMPPELLPPKRNQNANSAHRLSRLDVQRAITDVKRFVEARLESDLDLVKVSSSLSDPALLFLALSCRILGLNAQVFI